MILGPRTLAAIAEGPLTYYGGRSLPRHHQQNESVEEFARRVAMIAQEEGFAAGARAQREMEPTPQMIDEGHKVRLNIEVGRASVVSVLTPNDKAAEIYRAMQRVAPLVGVEE